MNIQTTVNEETINVEIPDPISNAAGEVIVAREAGWTYAKARINLIPDEGFLPAGVKAASKVLNASTIQDGPQKGIRYVEVIAGKKALRIALTTRPELAALVENRDAINEAIFAAREKVMELHCDEQAQREAERDAPYRAKMREEEAALVAQIPAGHVRLDVEIRRDSENGDSPRFSYNGVPIREGYHFIGWASAIRPGAINSFDSVCVASISPENLAEAVAKHEALKAAKDAKNAERHRKASEEAERRQALQSAIRCSIVSRGSIPGEDGRDPHAIVELESVETGEKLRFSCRNIFDFGFTVNPAYSVAPGLEPGGLAEGDNWMTFEPQKGWFPVRPITDFERLALDYIREFPPISTEMRM